MDMDTKAIVERIQDISELSYNYYKPLVETVCLLVLRNPVTHINIDVEEMMQDKRELAIYGQIEDYVLEQSGWKHFGMIQLMI